MGVGFNAPHPLLQEGIVMAKKTNMDMPEVELQATDKVEQPEKAVVKTAEQLCAEYVERRKKALGQK